ncbi:MAG: hypothetical protein ACO3N7_07405 [Kiritimatiellia bacterium]
MKFSGCLFYLFFLGMSAGWAASAATDSLPLISGRLRSVSMNRDYEGKGSGSNSSLGILLQAEARLWEGGDAGATYIYAEEVYASGQSEMLSNNAFHLLNEAWLDADLAGGSAIRGGRMVYNGEVFRKDDSRQKPRAIEAVEWRTETLRLGHALRMSNYLQSGDRWEFNSFDEVLKAGEDSEGMSWIEMQIPLSANLICSLYDAVAWRVSNLAGSRLAWQISGDLTLLGYLRLESGLDQNRDHQSETYGLSVQKKWGGLLLESGLLSVQGDDMLFEETTTGFNHALASCMIIYSCPFDAGADTLYLKAKRKLGSASLYLLGIVTWHSRMPFDAEEMNLVLTHPLTDQVDIAVKAGVGYRQNDLIENSTATDARLFLTYRY